MQIGQGKPALLRLLPFRTVGLFVAMIIRAMQIRRQRNPQSFVALCDNCHPFHQCQHRHLSRLPRCGQPQHGLAVGLRTRFLILPKPIFGPNSRSFCWKLAAQDQIAQNSGSFCAIMQDSGGRHLPHGR